MDPEKHMNDLKEAIMRKQGVIIFSTIILFLAMAIAACAQGKALKTHTDTTLKFTIKYPSDWKVQNEEGKKDRVYIASPDESTVVAISVLSPGSKISAKDFLKAMEQKLAVKNVMDQKDRPFDEETCEAMNVDEGYCGAYVMKQDGKEVYSMMNVFTKENKIYFLMLSASVQDELDKFGDILASFRAL
jgi:hypothetical protein